MAQISKKSGKLSWRGLTPQLFALIILPLSLLIVAIAFGGLNLHRQSMRTLVGERDERAVRAAASTISEELNHRAKSMQSLALRSEGKSDPMVMEHILETSDFLLPDFDLGMAFFNRNGSLLASTGNLAFWNALASGRNPKLISGLSQGTPPTFLPLSHPTTGESVIVTMASPSEDGAVAAGAFTPVSLGQRALAGVFTTNQQSVLFMVDQNGTPLYQVGNLPGGFEPAHHPGVVEALRGNSGAIYLPIENEEHVIAYSPIPKVNWVLVIDEPWESVASPILRTTEYAPLVLIPALFLALVALWFGVRQIIQPLQALENKASDLGWGDYEAIEEPVGGIAEIQRLQTELVHLAHKVKMAQQGLRGYIGAITLGQEEERRRLARELHDDTLQSLIALNQRVQLAILSADGGEETKELEEIQELTNQTIQNLRRITSALRPIYLEDLGLVTALEMLARESQKSYTLKVTFRCEGTQRRLPPTTELALYRIAQEALSNVVRHAQGSSAKLNLHFHPESVTLSIMDDGVGFDEPDSPAELASHGHFGLLGMHERAESIGAELRIESSIGEKTKIEVHLPSA